MSLNDRQDLEDFAQGVLGRLGLRVDEHNADQVEQVLQQRLERTGSTSVRVYVRRCQQEAGFGREELRELARGLTVPETYFFRHREQFEVLREVALPERLRAREGNGELRVLSAGSASGEEAYSMAATVLKVAGSAGVAVRVVGVDANGKLLEKARKAHYSEWALRGLGKAERDQLFHRDGSQYVLKERVKSMVQFEEGNLLEESWWPEGQWDIIFCRNVLIYFSAPAVRKLVGLMGRALVGGGFLFLGPSETLRGLSQEFHLRHTHGAFYYQRRLPGEKVTVTLAGAEGRPDELRSPPGMGAHDPDRRGGRERGRGGFADRGASSGLDPAGKEERVRRQEGAPPFVETSWMSSIAAASERIAALTRGDRPLPEGEGEERAQPGWLSAKGEQSRLPSSSAVEGLEEARRLLQEERFEEALAVLERARGQGGADPDRVLIEGVLLVNRGEVGRARQLCEQLLARDELRPGAHYLMAVCEEKSGQELAAAEHDQAAIYLDEKFAMPRLHLGLLARRLGDLGTARKELGQALSLLASEDAGRLLLFGGGFSREALVRFCRAQLELCGDIEGVKR